MPSPRLDQHRLCGLYPPIVGLIPVEGPSPRLPERRPMNLLLNGLHFVDEYELAHKRVFVRVDLDVGTAADLAPRDIDAKLLPILPTLKQLVQLEARPVLAAHRGRPKGKSIADLGLEPVGARLAELTGWDVLLPDDCLGEAAHKAVQDLRTGQLVLLENLRFHAEEESGDEGFARKLAEFADVYVTEALGACNRPHASVSVLPRLFRERAVGPAIKAELEALSRLQGSELPLTIFLGGTRLGERGSLIEEFLVPDRTLFLGGALGATFLAATGKAMGSTPIDQRELARARTLMELAILRGATIVLPSDVVVATDPNQAQGRTVSVTEVGDTDQVVDLGPESIARMGQVLEKAKTALWIGAMGHAGNPAFAEATLELARLLARSPVFGVVVGTAATSAARSLEPAVAETIGHLCTGGGASLELLENRRLPGLEALRMGG
jgi:phosphoglycerate kinase